MRFCNSTETYGFISKLLHGLIALIVLIMLVMGVSFDYIPKNIEIVLMPIHKSLGVTLLFLMFFRLIWWCANPVPQLPNHMKHWEKILARLVHGLFYILLILMPLTGIVMTLAGGHPLPFWSMGEIHLSFIPLNKALSHWMNAWHAYLAWIIFALFFLHTVAALKHHFIDKDGLLKRMF